MKSMLSTPMVLVGVTCLLGGCIAGPSCSLEVDRPGTPTIALMSVPPIGSDRPVTGQISHVALSSADVTTHILVDVGGWVKPCFASPETTNRCGSAFSADFVTGGNDAQAIAVAAFLLPKDISRRFFRAIKRRPRAL